MNILYIIHQFYPNHYSGTERVVFETASYMQKLGHKVTILTYSHEDNYTYQNSQDEIMYKEFMYQVICINDRAYSYASKKLGNDKKFFFKVLKKASHAMRYAGKRLKDDKEVLLKALENDIHAFYHASKRLRGDKDVAFSAIRRYEYNLEYACDELKNDKDFILYIIEDKLKQVQGNDSCKALRSWLLVFISDELKKDIVFINNAKELLGLKGQ